MKNWEKVKGKLKEILPESIFKVWFDPLKGIIEKEKLIIEVPNEFTKNWLKTNYEKLLNQTVQEFGLKKIEFIVKELPKAEQLLLPYNPVSLIGKKLSPKYTFEDFVVGKCNELAYSVCYQIVEKKLKGYLVYLYGNFGLGKTHLTQAVGNSFFSKGFNKVYYLTAQDFLNYMIKYLKSGMLEIFKEKFKEHCEILLLDGIHFLAGKEYTQNELIYLLDYFLDNNKTVIFTSLKPPQELQKMESGLCSRLSSGLIIKLNSPDFITRKKIIKHKAKKLGYNFPYEVVEYLAYNLKGDIRQIESAVLGLVARASVLREPVSLILAKELISELGIKEGTAHMVNLIIESTCRFLGVSKEDIFSSSRKQNISLARQIIMYILRRKVKKSLKEIGKLFKKEHSTVIYNIKALEKKLQDQRFKIKFDLLMKEISQELEERNKFSINEKINDSFYSF